MDAATTQDDVSTDSGLRQLDRLAAPERVVWRAHILTSRDPDRRGTTIEIAAGRTILGRNPGAIAGAVAVADKRLSRRHLAIRFSGVPGDGVELTDLSSRNGTWVGGRRVNKLLVGDGAVIRVGDSVLVLEEDDCRDLDWTTPNAEIPGKSRHARHVRGALSRAAGSGRPVLLQGPTGTGKEFAAGLLHRLSARTGPLVRVNVSAIPDNLFESQLFGHPKGAFTGAKEALPGRIREAEGGTLVLDEIGELPAHLQPKLLRALESGAIRPVGGRQDVRVDVRFAASTNANLDKLVADGTFRRDLAARFSTHVVQVEPLARRRGDLVALADAVLPPTDAGSWAEVLSADAIEALCLCQFQDNLRGLYGALLHVQEQGERRPVSARALPKALLKEVQRKTGESGALEGDAGRNKRGGRPSKEVLVELLKRHHGNVEAVGRVLGKDRKQVYRWLDHAGIDRSELERLRSLTT